MSQSRIAKAKRGEAVSRLPIGWVKGPDEKYQFDPQCEGTIRLIIDTFFQTRSILSDREGAREKRRSNTLSMRPAGRFQKAKHVPGRKNTNKSRAMPEPTSMPGPNRRWEAPCCASGHSKRVKVTEDRWIKTFNHHPAYMTPEQQEEIKSILKKITSTPKSTRARETANFQGLFRCAVCGSNLAVSYPGSTYHYVCNKAHHYGTSRARPLPLPTWINAYCRKCSRCYKLRPLICSSRRWKQPERKNTGDLTGSNPNVSGLHTSNGWRRSARILPKVAFRACTEVR